MTQIQSNGSTWRIPEKTSMGPVHYTVANLDAQVAFYREIIGMRLLKEEGGVASLGVEGRELLRLTEQPGARRERGTTGLYHTAFLVPTQRDLAHLFRRAMNSGVRLHGTSNHGTHLAIYLPDLEGNGIELAWDFPEDQWPFKDGRWDMESISGSGVDIAKLLQLIEDDTEEWEGMPPETVVGHVHLHVNDLDAAQQFYHGLLGFDITIRGESFGALFVSAGGYHHHIGTNIWRGEGAPAPSSQATGLRWFSVKLPDQGAIDQLVQRLNAAGIETVYTDEGVLTKDPAQNGLLLTA